MKKIYVGMSGGVDSSVSAALLKEQGYNVVGVYMKNWSQDLPGHHCPWQEDFQDAKRVAVQLGIPFKMFDFQKQYRQKVVDYMVEGYKAGRTPNPDIMCNQEIKFKLFLDTALEDGADLIATGHYARVDVAGGSDEGSERFRSRSAARTSEESLAEPPFKLLKAIDENKDQTYFLYRVSQEALSKTLFPVGGLTKPEVRKLAAKLGLATATKKESMGICFVGKVGIKEFLLYELGPQEAGDIVDQHGSKIGRHDGAIFYTIGQRHGLDVGGGLPYYVTGKNMAKNEVYVTTDLGDENLWSSMLKLTDVHWISGQPTDGETSLMVRTRHRAPLVPVKNVKKSTNGNWELMLGEEIRALTPGQSAVVYLDDVCLGGGILV